MERKMQFISRKDLAARRSISLSSQKRLETDPRHPKPVNVSPGRVAFVEPEADEFDLLLIAERDRALADIGENKSTGEAATA